MGRQLTLPLFVSTLVATWYGGIFGVTKIAFESGIYNFITQGVFWYIAYITFALFLVHRISRFQAVTLPELIGQMFGPKSAKISACFNFFNVLPIAYTISIGLLLQSLFGFHLNTAMLIGLSFVTVYSLFGGFRAVVFSDLVQFSVMCLSVLLVVVFAFTEFGGYDFLQAQLPASHFTLTGQHGIGATLVWGLIAISTLVDPNFYQRVFAARSPQIARRGILISTGVWIAFDLCTTLGAMYARAVLPEAESENAYLLFSSQILPSGFRGFFLAGIVATILSTIDSYLFIAGTTLSYDLLPNRMRSISKTKVGILLCAVIAYAMAVAFNGDIKAVWKTLGTYSSACLLFPVLFGYLRPGRISDYRFLSACLTAVLTTTYWRLYSPWPIIDEIYIGILTTAIILLPKVFTTKSHGVA